MTILEIEGLLKEFGEPKFRAKQIFLWLQSGVETFDEMTNIPQKLRQKLEEECYIANVKIVKRFNGRLRKKRD